MAPVPPAVDSRADRTVLGAVVVILLAAFTLIVSDAIGIDAFRLISISAISAFGVQRTTSIGHEAGLRLFIDITPPSVLR